jgi:hypothetical protein
MVDVGEQCDLGRDNGVFGSCCDATCHWMQAGQRCRTSTNPCQADAVCTGDAATCPPNPPIDAALCRDGNACTVEDRCVDGACAPGASICAVNAIRLGGKIVATCRAEQLRAGATCTVSGAVAADTLLPVPDVASRAGNGSTSGCNTKRLAKLTKRGDSLRASCIVDGSQVEVCRSASKQLKAAGSPVKLRCKPNDCFEAFSRLKRTVERLGADCAVQTPELQALTVVITAFFEKVGGGEEELGQVGDSVQE